MSRFTGKQYRGASNDAKAIRRQEAESRQHEYDTLLATGPDVLRQYRDRTVRPRLGRKMREGIA